MDDQDVTGKKMGEAAPARSPWLVAAGVLGVVVLGLVLAFALDRRFRPTVAVEPTRPVAVMVPTAAPRAQGPGGATAAATGAVLSLAATPRPGLTPTLPGGLRLADSPLEREVEAAYLHYWDVRTQAFLNLDSSRLGEVMAGDELARAEKYIQDLRSQGRAAKMDVEHRIALPKVTPDEAVVYDEYLNKSVFVDSVTKQELKTDAPVETVKVSFYLSRIDGQWKVTGGARHD